MGISAFAKIFLFAIIALSTTSATFYPYSPYYTSSSYTYPVSSSSYYVVYPSTGYYPVTSSGGYYYPNYKPTGSHYYQPTIVNRPPYRPTQNQQNNYRPNKPHQFRPISNNKPPQSQQWRPIPSYPSSPAQNPGSRPQNVPQKPQTPQNSPVQSCGGRDCVCSYVLNPVCGSDGNEYDNYCLLNCMKKCTPNLRVTYTGYCKKSAYKKQQGYNRFGQNYQKPLVY